jgi:hypothetical protein
MLTDGGVTGTRLVLTVTSLAIARAARWPPLGTPLAVALAGEAGRAVAEDGTGDKPLAGEAEAEGGGGAGCETGIGPNPSS